MKKYDIAVVGGGLSGVAAAVSASRMGLSVLLIEKEGALGGAMSNNLVYPFMKYWTVDPENGDKKLLSDGIFSEIRKRHSKYDSRCSLTSFKPEYYKFTLDELIQQSNVDVIFHGILFDVKADKQQIKSLKIAAKSGVIEAEADFFIDATGDGALFFLAGCDFQLGREEDGLCQPMTTCFRISGVDMQIFNADRVKLQEAYKKEQKEGKIRNPREDILFFTEIGDGILHFNTTRVIKLDPTDPFDFSRAEIAARKQIAEMDSFLRRNSKAFDNSTIINIAGEIGVRESRKLKGIHVLTVQELKNCTKFSDSVALGNYDIDIHNPAGSGTSHYYFSDGKYYTIPYRCLVPKEIDNLLVTGRCISATHEAQASVRIMPICACLGQAAGTAAALSIITKRDNKSIDIKLLQNKLTENGAAIF